LKSWRSWLENKDNLQKYVPNYQAIKAVSTEKSSNQKYILKTLILVASYSTFGNLDLVQALSSRA